MSVFKELDHDLVALPLKDLKKLLAQETANGEALNAEMQTIGGLIDQAVATDDVERSLELGHRNSQLPVRLIANQVRRSLIEIALREVRRRERAQPAAQAESELRRQEKAKAKVEEAYQQAQQAWFQFDFEDKEDERMQFEFSARVHELRAEQARRLRQATGGMPRRTAA